MLHLIVHLLDDARAQGDSTFSWNAVKGNVGSMPYCGAVAALLWPKLRKWLAAEFHAETAKAHAEVDRLKKELEAKL